MHVLGQQYILEFYQCNPDLINNIEYIDNVMVTAAKKSGATVISHNFHLFEPYGVSGVVVIAESHLTIHTWPEYGYCAVDIFTCGSSVDPSIAEEYLKEKFDVKRVVSKKIDRGILPHLVPNNIIGEETHGIYLNSRK